MARYYKLKGGGAGYSSSLRFFMFNNNSAYNLSDNLISMKRKEGIKEGFQVSDVSISNNIFNTSSTKDTVKTTDYVIDIDVPSLKTTNFSSNIITGQNINLKALRISGDTESNLIIKDNIISGSK